MNIRKFKLTGQGDVGPLSLQALLNETDFSDEEVERLIALPVNGVARFNEETSHQFSVIRTE